MTFFKDKLEVKIFETRAQMGLDAGTDIANCMLNLLKTKPFINVMFAAAPSQNDTLKTLVDRTDIPWNRVNAFHMDEYVGLEESHPAGFRNFLKKAIFDLKPFASINLLNGNSPDATLEASRYGALLKDHPLDICVLGVGENGHIAFNDPPVANFSDPLLVKVVELEQRCRQQQVNDGCFASISQVPTHALSATIPALVNASYMFCSVPAPTKAQAIFHMLNDDISTSCPATILRTHENAKLYLDSDSSSLLKL